MFHNNYTQVEYCSYHIILSADPQTKTGQLILGDLNAATDLKMIQQHHVKTIITAANGLEHLQISSELTHIVFPLLDIKQENIQQYFQLSYQTIEQNRKRGSVLVHCGAGISRSATLVIAYYMKKYNADFASALKAVRSRRPNICPNLGFERQLKQYQEQLKEHIQDNKKIHQTKERPVTGGSKKQKVEPKQMLLTFNGSAQKEKGQEKSQRMSHTQYGQFTPSFTRKGVVGKKSRVQRGQFCVLGQQVKGGRTKEHITR